MSRVRKGSLCYADKLLLKIRAACHRSQPRDERAVSLSPTHPHLQGVGRGEELEGERSHMAEDLMGLKKPPQKPKRKRLGELRAGAQSSGPRARLSALLPSGSSRVMYIFNESVI